MPGKLQYSPSEYRSMVRISEVKHILVEGQDDKRCLMYLIQEIFGERNDVEIYGAYQISSEAEEIVTSQLGNREKVEEISQKISKSAYASRFVGFVDRELRGFDLEEEIKDLVGKHNIIDRLVWSKGHSIENYFFDFAVLARPLRDHSVTLYFHDALGVFKRNIEQILREACAIGLAAWKCNSLKWVRSSVKDWSIVEIGEQGITVNTSKWMEIITKKQKRSYDEALNLKEAYQEWSIKISKIDFSVVRWLCDGHIGLTFVWAAFARCVFEVSKKSGQGDPMREASSVLRSDETVRFNGCASEWVSQAKQHLCEYPTDIFTILGLSVE